MITTRGRLLLTNQVIFDQADFFESDGFTRVLGLGVADLAVALFFNNLLQPWPLLLGNDVTDAQVRSGSIYWSEVAGSPGIYSVRLRPNAIGYWRLLLTYTAGEQIRAQDYDIAAQIPVGESGLKASFVKP
jgi:hypothetical protein